MKPESIISLIITITICLILLVAVISPMITKTPIQDEGREVIEKTIMALIAIVSYSLGKSKR